MQFAIDGGIPWLAHISYLWMLWVTIFFEVGLGVVFSCYGYGIWVRVEISKLTIWLPHNFITEACFGFVVCLPRQEQKSLSIDMKFSVVYYFLLSSLVTSFLPSYLFVWSVIWWTFGFFPVHCDRRCTCWCSSCKSCGNEVHIGFFFLLSKIWFPYFGHST